jgi:hypothetical protein
MRLNSFELYFINLKNINLPAKENKLFFSHISKIQFKDPNKQHK